MVWEDSRRVLYSEFQSAVKQLDTVELLREIASQSARLKQFEGWDPAWSTIAPWSLAAIAREAILSSNTSRGKPLDNRRFVRLLNLLRQVDVIPNDGLKPIPFFMSLNYMQFPYQISVKEEIARSMLVLLETSIDQASKSADEMAELLMAPLEDVPYSTFILWALARSSNGMIHPNMILNLYRDSADKLPPIESVLGTLLRLTSTLESARNDGMSATPMNGGLQQFGYNPLSRTPFISVGDGWLCAPQSQFILRTCSLEAIYYAGLKKWPSGDLSTELGHRVEAYIGTQLRHTGLLDVRPEFVTGVGTKSIDWIVVTPAAVLLIESKGARIPIEVRAGLDAAAQLVTDRLAIAYTQLNRTADGVRAALPLFAHIPNDRPIIGIIVTVEPVYMANAAEVRALLPASAIPIATVSARDFEQLCTWDADALGSTLLAWVSHATFSGHDLFGALREMGVRGSDWGNDLIDQAFQRYIWTEDPAVKVIG